MDYRATDNPEDVLANPADQRTDLVFIAISEPGQATTIEALLESLSYKPRIFLNEVDLIEAAQHRSPQYLLLDVDFEGIHSNGYQVAADFPQSSPRAKVIMLTDGETDMIHRLRAAKAGAAGILNFDTNASALWAFLDDESEFLESTPTVLVIDDSPTDALNTVRQLRKGGIEAEHITSPYEVITACERLRPDMLITDYYMPECTGDVLVRALRMDRGYASLPIIYLSSESNEDRQLNAMSNGADDFMTKPIDGEYLVRSVLNRVARARRTRLMSERDSMSGLLDHATCLDILRREMDVVKEQGGELSLALMDLDRFKQVNDEYGHQIGDQVIRSFSAFLKRNLRRTDSVARYGGEEFCIVLPGTTLEDAYMVLNRIRRLFAELPHINHEGKPFTVTFSAGVVAYDGISSDLMFHADEALYEAKQHGRNTIKTRTIHIPTSASL